MGRDMGTFPSGSPDVGLAQVDGGGRCPLPNVSPGGPPWGGPLAGTPGDYHRPGGTDTRDQIPVDEGLVPSRRDSRRIEDLEPDMEDAEATCQALSSEQELRM